VSILRHRERFSDRLRVQTLPGAAETLIGTEMVAIALLAGILNAMAGAVLWLRMSSRR
jgi:hypothetical protein